MKPKKFNPKIVSINRGLDISRDYNFKPRAFFPVFLFTPHISDPNNHFHISLTKTQARKLRDWLTDYLKDRK
jgi:hypothetical protein